MNNRAVVAIDGIDGSGKSTLADRLLDRLRAGGVGAVLLHVDDFRRAIDWSRADKSEVDIYYDDYFDLGRLDGCLHDFLDGRSAIDVPVYDATRPRESATRRIDLDGVAIALCEGVFVQRLPCVATPPAAAVYVEASPHAARRRILARDVAAGRTPAEAQRRIDVRYFPAQDLYRAACDPIGRAAVVVDNEDPGAPRALRFDEERLPAPVARALTEILNPPMHPIVSRIV
jgi:uridine kinase